jgi:glycosyltransferase involved in cell wall biosynthesis
MIKINIVTISFNSKKTIQRTLESVKQVREKIDKYIIIDGGSIDGTLEIIKEYKYMIDFIISEKDKGISDAFNKGIALCDNESHILLLNSDDELIAENFKKLILNEDASEKIICAQIVSKRNGKFLGVIGSQPELIKKGNYMVHPSTLINKQVYMEIGGYNLDYKIGMDYEFFARCHAKKINFHLIDYPLVIFHEGGRSSYQIFNNIKDSFRVRVKYFNAIWPWREFKTLLRHILKKIFIIRIIYNQIKK